MANTPPSSKNPSEATTEPVVSTQEPIQSANSGSSRKKLILFGLVGVLIGLALASAAFIYYTNSRPKTPVIAKVGTTTQPSSIPTPDQTADWREVTMPNWQLKIPADWHYLACEDSVQYFGKEFKSDDDNPDCGFDGFPGDLLIIKDTKSEEFKIPVSDEFVTVTNKVSTKIDGLDAVKQQEAAQTEGPGAGTYLNAYIPSKKISITFDNESQPDVFDQILENFKLTQ